MNTAKALIIDESKSARIGLRKKLQKLHLDVELAETEQIALDRLSQSPEELPDVIFIDQSIPGMGCFEMIKVIQQNPDWSSIDVIMCTPEEIDVTTEKALTHGFTAVINKPANQSEVQDIINQLGLTKEVQSVSSINERNEESSNGSYNTQQNPDTPKLDIDADEVRKGLARLLNEKANHITEEVNQNIEKKTRSIITPVLVPLINTTIKEQLSKKIPQSEGNIESALLKKLQKEFTILTKGVLDRTYENILNNPVQNKLSTKVDSFDKKIKQIDSNVANQIKQLKKDQNLPKIIEGSNSLKTEQKKINGQIKAIVNEGRTVNDTIDSLERNYQELTEFSRRNSENISALAKKTTSLEGKIKELIYDHLEKGQQDLNSQYKAIKDSNKGLSITTEALKNSTKSIHQRFDALKSDTDSLIDSTNSLVSETDAIKSDTDKLRQENTDLRNEIAQLKQESLDKLNEFEFKFNVLEKYSEVKPSNEDSSEQHEERDPDEITSQLIDKEITDFVINEVKGSLEALLERVDNNSSTIETLSTTVDSIADKSAEQIQQSLSEVQNYEYSIKEIQDKLQLLSDTSEDTQEKVNSLCSNPTAQDLQSVEQSIEEIHTHLASLSQQLEDRQTQISTHEIDDTKNQAKYEALNQQIDKLQDQINNLPTAPGNISFEKLNKIVGDISMGTHQKLTTSLVEEIATELEKGLYDITSDVEIELDRQRHILKNISRIVYGTIGFSVAAASFLFIARNFF